MTESELRDAICAHGRLLYGRGYCVGSAGNISVRLRDGGGVLMTPTNSCLGRLEPDRISKLDAFWRHVAGDKPSKEVFMHRAVLGSRPEAGAVVHLHSTHATAIACLAAPGDPAAGPAIAEAAKGARALLLGNHGPVVSGKTLDDAVWAAEELEEAARLALMLRGLPGLRALDAAQVDDLLATFG